MKARAIIVAAGKGERIGGNVPKQFIEIKKKPILAYTIERFERCEQIDEIVLVVPEDYMSFCSYRVVDVCDFVKVKKIIGGGKERQDSVYKGLSALPVDTDMVLIHDGVRPFISIQKLRKLIGLCEKEKAVILAQPIKETVKRVEDHNVITTLDREKLWIAQTPQVFEYKLILKAYKKALEDGFIGTDDSSLVERLGFKVKVLEGEYGNIKITTADDLILAERIIERLDS
ncbi:MAG: 2-C-methyl-D-erythritol 4-phosphate cytidylyltransferase [candidate division Zixibacteria bacterium]|nr:2-C-methyl-D-erythritol 4-phosphate cytidylyltransferase [candidate division Zixibacteria bacterium]